MRLPSQGRAQEKAAENIFLFLQQTISERLFVSPAYSLFTCTKSRARSEEERNPLDFPRLICMRKADITSFHAYVWRQDLAH